MTPVVAPSPPASPKIVLRRTLIRVAVAAVLIGCVLLANWSWKRLQPVNKQLIAATATLSHLGDEAQQIEQRWDPAEAERVEAAFTAASSALFTNKEEVASWQSKAERTLRQHAFESTVRRGVPQTRTNGLQQISLTSVTLDLRPAAVSQSTNTPYQRLLSLMHTLDTTKKRADLIEFTARGSSNSVQQAHVVYQLWTREEEAAR